MTPEQWGEIERLYLAALERDLGERAAFLEGACGGDDGLRREVESLLEYQPKAKDFLEPAGNGGGQTPSGSREVSGRGRQAPAAWPAGCSAPTN